MSKSLMECESDADFVRLPRDNFSKDDYSLICDGFNVWLTEQVLGEQVKQEIQIPKKVFDYLIRKYEEPQ